MSEYKLARIAELEAERDQLKAENERLSKRNTLLSGPTETVTVCEKGKPYSFMAQDPCRYSLCEVTYAQPVYDLISERDTLRNALEHVQKTCKASRTETRRLRWIDQRAQWALDGKPYSDEAFDLPKDATHSREKLALENKELRKQLDEARNLLWNVREGLNSYDHEKTVNDWLEENK